MGSEMCIRDRTSTAPSLSDEESVPEISFTLASLSQGIRQAYSKTTINSDVITAYHQLLPRLLLLAVCTIWWNPQLRQWYSRHSASMTHLGEYYAVQPIILFCRMAAIHFLSPLNHTLEDDIRKGAHGFIALLIFAVSTVRTSLWDSRLTLMSPCWCHRILSVWTPDRRFPFNFMKTLSCQIFLLPTRTRNQASFMMNRLLGNPSQFMPLLHHSRCQA